MSGRVTTASITAAPSRTGRRTSLAAILFPALTVAAFAVVGEPPAADASAQQVVAFYIEHENGVFASAILGTLAAAALVWFASQLHGHIRARGPEAGAVASVVFGAALLIAAGFTVFAGIEVTAAGTVQEISPESLQTLNALDNGMFFTVALGNLLMYSALAVASLRHGAFPRQLGWATAALAVLSVTPAFFVALVAAVVVYPLLGWLMGREPSASDPAKSSGTAQTPPSENSLGRTSSA
jgi:hypothetical protein